MQLNEHLSDVHVTERFLSGVECEALLSSVQASQFWAGRLIDPVPNYRICDVTDQIDSTTLLSLTNRLMAQVHSINRIMYRFDLSNEVEPLQILKYGPGGKIDWHMDVGPNIVSTRKLGVTIQLSEPTAYLGGDLEFSPPIDARGARLLGSAVIFPSYLTHRITPISSGTRWAAVTWFHGRPFQ